MSWQLEVNVGPEKVESQHNQIVQDPKSPTRLVNSMIQVVRMGSLGGDNVILIQYKVSRVVNYGA